MAAYNLQARIAYVNDQASLAAAASQAQRAFGSLPPVNLAGAASATKDVAALKQQAQLLGSTLAQVNASGASFSRVGVGAASASGPVANLTRQLAQAQAAASAAGASTSTAARSLANFGEQAGLAARRFVAFTVAAGGIISAVSAFRAGISEAIKFEQTFNKIRQVARDTESNIAAVAAEVTRVSQAFGVSSSQMAGVAEQLTQVGLNAKEVQAALQPLAEASIAPSFGGDFTKITQGAVAAMQQFGIETSKTREAIGSINAVSQNFAVEAEDIIEATKRAGGAFKAAGGDYEEFIGLFTSVRATTRESAEAIATGLRTIFARLQRPETIQGLKDLQIELRRTREEADALGQPGSFNKFVGVDEAVGRISSGLSGTPTNDPRYAQVVSLLGGERQLSRVLPLIQQYGLAQQAKSVAQTGGVTLSVAADKRQETTLNKVEKVREQFLELFRSLTDSTGFKSFVDGMLAVGSAVKTVVGVLQPLLPLAGVLAASSLARVAASTVVPAVTKFSTVQSKNSGGVVGFNSGGLVGSIVPGVGDTDSVPATLPVGSFVLRKRAVQAMLTPGEVVVPPGETARVGAGRLNNVNRYAGGGEADLLKYLKQKKYPDNAAFGGVHYERIDPYKGNNAYRESSIFIDKPKIILPGYTQETLTEQEVAEVRDYTSAGHVVYNGGLRRGGTMLPRRQAKIDTLSGAVRKGKLPANQTLYRGFGANAVAALAAQGFNFREGEVLEDPAFLSTSLSLPSAAQFKYNDGDGGLLADIVTGKKSRGLLIPNVVGLNEEEVLLPPSTRLKVVGGGERPKLQAFASGGVISAEEYLLRNRDAVAGHYEHMGLPPFVQGLLPGVAALDVNHDQAGPTTRGYFGFGNAAARGKNTSRLPYVVGRIRQGRDGQGRSRNVNGSIIDGRLSELTAKGLSLSGLPLSPEALQLDGQDVYMGGFFEELSAKMAAAREEGKPYYHELFPTLDYLSEQKPLTPGRKEQGLLTELVRRYRTPSAQGGSLETLPLLSYSRQGEPGSDESRAFNSLSLEDAVVRLAPALRRYASGGRVAPISPASLRDILTAQSERLTPGNKWPIASLVSGLLSDRNSLKRVARQIPTGSTKLASGTEALVLQTPAKEVVRLGRLYNDEQSGRSFSGRLDIPEVLQPTRSRQINDYLVERLPFIPSLRDSGERILRDDTYEEIARLRASLKAQGYDANDLIGENLGRGADGRLIILDPGAVQRKSSGGLADFSFSRQNTSFGEELLRRGVRGARRRNVSFDTGSLDELRDTLGVPGLDALTPEYLGTLAGAGPDDSVNIGGQRIRGGYGLQARVRASGRYFSALRDINLFRGVSRDNPDPHAIAEVTNRYFEVDDYYRGSGVGASVYARQSLAAVGSEGLFRRPPKFGLQAARGNDLQGYYVWPSKFGADNRRDPLNNSLIDPIEPGYYRDRLKKAVDYGTLTTLESERIAEARPDTVRGLLSLPGGDAFWKRHGRSIDVGIDPSEGFAQEKLLQRRFAGGGVVDAREYLRGNRDTLTQYVEGLGLPPFVPALIGGAAVGEVNYRHRRRLMDTFPFPAHGHSGVKKRGGTILPYTMRDLSSLAMSFDDEDLIRDPSRAARALINVSLADYLKERGFDREIPDLDIGRVASSYRDVLAGKLRLDSNETPELSILPLLDELADSPPVGIGDDYDRLMLRIGTPGFTSSRRRRVATVGGDFGPDRSEREFFRLSYDASPRHGSVITDPFERRLEESVRSTVSYVDVKPRVGKYAVGGSVFHSSTQDINAFRSGAGSSRRSLIEQIFDSRKIQELPPPQRRYVSGLSRHTLTDEAASLVPRGSEFLGFGLTALAFREPKGTVLRLQNEGISSIGNAYKQETDGIALPDSFYSVARPNIAGLLQNIGSVGAAGTYVERLPFAERFPHEYGSPGHRAAEGELTRLLKPQGYGFRDSHPGNIGVVNGRNMVIDPGAIARLEEMYPGLAPTGPAGYGLPVRRSTGGPISAEEYLLRNRDALSAQYEHMGLPPFVPGLVPGLALIPRNVSIGQGQTIRGGGIASTRGRKGAASSLPYAVSRLHYPSGAGFNVNERPLLQNAEASVVELMRRSLPLEPGALTVHGYPLSDRAPNEDIPAMGMMDVALLKQNNFFHELFPTLDYLSDQTPLRPGRKEQGLLTELIRRFSNNSVTGGSVVNLDGLVFNPAGESGTQEAILSRGLSTLRQDVRLAPTLRGYASGGPISAEEYLLRNRDEASKYLEAKGLPPFLAGLFPGIAAIQPHRDSELYPYDVPERNETVITGKRGRFRGLAYTKASPDFPVANTDHGLFDLADIGLRNLVRTRGGRGLPGLSELGERPTWRVADRIGRARSNEEFDRQYGRIFGRSESPLPPGNPDAAMLLDYLSEQPSLRPLPAHLRELTRLTREHQRGAGLADEGSVVSLPSLVFDPKKERVDSKYSDVRLYAPPSRYASGGNVVPGSGSTDSVPAVLPQNSFVLKKSSREAVEHASKTGMVPALLTPGEKVFLPDEVQKIGLSKLHRMNSMEPRRYAGGGLVRLNDGGKLTPAQRLRQKKEEERRLAGKSKPVAETGASFGSDELEQYKQRQADEAEERRRRQRQQDEADRAAAIAEQEESRRRSLAEAADRGEVGPRLPTGPSPEELRRSKLLRENAGLYQKYADEGGFTLGKGKGARFINQKIAGTLRTRTSNSDVASVYLGGLTEAAATFDRSSLGGVDEDQIDEAFRNTVKNAIFGTGGRKGSVISQFRGRKRQASGGESAIALEQAASPEYVEPRPLAPHEKQALELAGQIEQTTTPSGKPRKATVNRVAKAFAQSRGKTVGRSEEDALAKAREAREEEERQNNLSGSIASGIDEALRDNPPTPVEAPREAPLPAPKGGRNKRFAGPIRAVDPAPSRKRLTNAQRKKLEQEEIASYARAQAASRVDARQVPYRLSPALATEVSQRGRSATHFDPDEVSDPGIGGDFEPLTYSPGRQQPTKAAPAGNPPVTPPANAPGVPAGTTPPGKPPVIPPVAAPGSPAPDDNSGRGKKKRYQGIRPTSSDSDIESPRQLRDRRARQSEVFGAPLDLLPPDSLATGEQERRDALAPIGVSARTDPRDRADRQARESIDAKAQLQERLRSGGLTRQELEARRADLTPTQYAILNKQIGGDVTAEVGRARSFNAEARLGPDKAKERERRFEAARQKTLDTNRKRDGERDSNRRRSRGDNVRASGLREANRALASRLPGQLEGFEGRIDDRLARDRDSIIDTEAARRVQRSGTREERRVANRAIGSTSQEDTKATLLSSLEAGTLLPEELEDARGRLSKTQYAQIRLKLNKQQASRRLPESASVAPDAATAEAGRRASVSASESIAGLGESPGISDRDRLTRDREVRAEFARQQKNNATRQEFAQKAGFKSYDEAVGAGVIPPKGLDNFASKINFSGGSSDAVDFRDVKNSRADLDTSKRLSEISGATATKAGAPVSAKTAEDVKNANLARQENQLKQELINAEKRLLQALYPNIDATEKHRLATEAAERALQGQTKVVLDPGRTKLDKNGKAVLDASGRPVVEGAGRLLGSEGNVELARQRGIKIPGEDTTNYLNRVAGNALSGAAGGLRSFGGFLGRQNDRFSSFLGSTGLSSGLAQTSLLALPLLSGRLDAIAGDPRDAAGSGSGYQGLRAASGGLQGAVLGATLGGQIPGLGAIGAGVGAVAGGVGGVVSAMRAAAEDIRSVRIDNALRVFGERLQTLASLGTGPLDPSSPAYAIADARTELESYNKSAEKRAAVAASGFTGLGFDARIYGETRQRNLRSDLGGQLPALQETLSRYAQREQRQNRGLEAKDVLQIVRDGNGGLNKEFISLIARVRGVSTRAVEDEQKKNIVNFQSQLKKEDVALEARTYEREINAFSRLLSSIQGADASLESLRQSAAALSDSFDGTINAAKVNAGAESVGQLDRGDPAALDSLRTLASIGGRDGSRLLESASGANQIASILPEVLAATARQSFSGQTADLDFSASVQKQLQDRSSGESARGIIAAVVRGLNEASGEKGISGIARELETDGSGFARRLLESSLAPIKEFGGGALTRIQNNANEYTQGLAVQRQRQSSAGDSEDGVERSRLNLTRLRADIEGSRTYRSGLDSVSLEQLNRPVQSRLQRLAGTDDPDSIGKTLKKVNEDIEKATERQQLEFKENPASQAFRDAATALTNLKGRASDLQNALKTLADSATRSAGAQEKLNNIKADEESRISFGSNYLSQNQEGRANLERGLTLFRQAARGGLASLTPEQQGEALGAGRSLGEARLPGVDGRRASDIVRELVQKFASSRFGFDITPESRKEKISLEEQLLKFSQDEVKSRENLVNEQKRLNDTFFTKLTALQEQFYAELRQSFQRSELSEKKGEILRKTGEVAREGEQKKSADVLSSLGITTDSQLQTAKASKGDIEKFNSLVATRDENFRKYESINQTLGSRSGEFLGTGGQFASPSAGYLRNGFFNTQALQEILGTELTPEQSGRIVSRGSALAYKDYAERRAASPEGPFSFRLGAQETRELQLNALRRAAATELTTSADGTSSRKTLFELDAVGRRLKDRGINTGELEARARAGQGGEVVAALGAFNSQNTLANFNKNAGSAARELKTLEEAAKSLGSVIREFDNSRAQASRNVYNEVQQSQYAVPGFDDEKFYVPGYRTGGPVYRMSGGSANHPGGPRGSDTIPAWLTEGEFVINRASSEANRGILEKINRAKGPIHLAGGGEAVSYFNPLRFFGDRYREDHVGGAFNFRNYAPSAPARPFDPSATGFGHAAESFRDTPLNIYRDSPRTAARREFEEEQRRREASDAEARRFEAAERFPAEAERERLLDAFPGVPRPLPDTASETDQAVERIRLLRERQRTLVEDSENRRRLADVEKERDTPEFRGRLDEIRRDYQDPTRIGPDFNPRDPRHVKDSYDANRRRREKQAEEAREAGRRSEEARETRLRAEEARQEEKLQRRLRGESDISEVRLPEVDEPFREPVAAPPAPPTLLPEPTEVPTRPVRPGSIRIADDIARRREESSRPESARPGLRVADDIASSREARRQKLLSALPDLEPVFDDRGRPKEYNVRELEELYRERNPTRRLGGESRPGDFRVADDIAEARRAAEKKQELEERFRRAREDNAAPDLRETARERRERRKEKAEAGRKERDVTDFGGENPYARYLADSDPYSETGTIARRNRLSESIRSKGGQKLSDEAVAAEADRAILAQNDSRQQSLFRSRQNLSRGASGPLAAFGYSRVDEDTTRSLYLTAAQRREEEFRKLARRDPSSTRYRRERPGVDIGPLQARGFAQGGLVPQHLAQGGGVDTVPAWLSAGEYVMPRRAVAGLGVQGMEEVRRYAEGGPVARYYGLGHVAQPLPGGSPSVSGDPSALRKHGSDMADHSASLKLFSAPVREFVGAVGDFGRHVAGFDGSVNNFGGSVTEFDEAVSKMPATVEMSGTHRMDVNVTGVNLEGLDGAIKEAVNSIVSEKLRDALTRNFPGRTLKVD